MGLPEGSLAIAMLVVVALPGLIYSAVRRWARGESAEDRDLGLSIARGVVFAIALTSAYLFILGDALFVGLTSGTDADTLTIADARSVALAVLGLYVVLPTVLAFILSLPHIEWSKSTWSRWVVLPRSRYGYSSTPTAWDHAMRRNQCAWVKIHRANGEWVGGWFTKGSFATAYPETQAIYIDQQWTMTAEGNYGAPVPHTGVHLTIADDDVVIWTRHQNSQSGEANP